MNNVERYVLPAAKLGQALDALLELPDQLIAPVQAARGDVHFESVEGVDQIQTDYGNTLVSPIEYLLPSQEIMFEYRLGPQGQPEFTAPAAPPDRIIFGLRPCDVAAIEYADHFYVEREPIDTLYAARRQATTLIALACAEPANETCFCSCCEGGGPVSESGFDIQLTPLGDQYLVEVATEKGQRIAQQWQSLVKPAADELLEVREAQTREVMEQQLEIESYLAAAIRRITAEKVNPDTWEAIGHDCYSCGGCSYLCPVCTCYDVVDVQYDDTSGARIRRTDSCRLAGFVREATGHIPRATASSRARWYAYHKLSYDYHEQYGRYGCVGCGRCVITCLGQIDMPAVCARVRQSETEAAS